MSGMFFSGFLFISANILLDLLSLGSAEAYIGWGGKLNGHLLASCARNICTINYQNLIIGFQVSQKCRGCSFWGTVYNADNYRIFNSSFNGAKNNNHQEIIAQSCTKQKLAICS